jgi:hypothetical protein
VRPCADDTLGSAATGCANAHIKCGA